MDGRLRFSLRHFVASASVRGGAFSGEARPPRAACVKQQRRILLPAGLFAAGGTVFAAAMIAPFHGAFVKGLADARLLTAIQSDMNRGLDVWAQLQALLISFAQTP